MKIIFDELYKTDCTDEHAYIAIPFKKGEVTKPEDLSVYDGDQKLPTASRVTAHWEDGSIKWGFFRFMCDLKRFSKTTLELKAGANVTAGLTLSGDTTLSADTGAIAFTLTPGKNLFKNITDGNITLTDTPLPILTDMEGNTYTSEISTWRILESNPLVCRIKGIGVHTFAEKKLSFEIYITAYYKKSHIDVGYRIINTDDAELKIKSIVCDLNFDDKTTAAPFIAPKKGHDSTGCGDITIDVPPQEGPIYHMMGLAQTDELYKKLGSLNLRNTIGMSNYRTEMYIRNDGGSLLQYADSDLIMKEANEHFIEVMYGTFFADRTDSKGGITATIYQAQQNYPKAVGCSADKIAIHIVPDCDDRVIMQSGMSRLQSFRLFFHEPELPIEAIDDLSLKYQLGNIPHLEPEYMRSTGVIMDIFTDHTIAKYEAALKGKADSHARAFGMLNFGDTPDLGYTKQGRGGGEIVWSNNEYDYPHACALIYMRTQTRRFFDYMRTAVSHWMDVDICHYSKNPLHLGGQWEHTNGHCKGGVMVASHEWVEGLLDYYHLTGDERAYDSAIRIGENVLRQLETPMFRKSGEANARETGWAMRTLVALFIETHDTSWLKKCDWIVSHFREWEAEYGHWLSPYTDNVSIRVPFMIAIAVGSLYRYYRIRPTEEVKDMILRAVDDMVENSIVDNLYFYYKGMPSLTRNGNNTLPLEALVIAYELTGDTTYLKHGVATFELNMLSPMTGIGDKLKREDAVITTGQGTKGFAQSFQPLVLFYKAAAKEGLIS